MSLFAFTHSTLLNTVAFMAALPFFFFFSTSSVTHFFSLAVSLIAIFF